ncbi:restriction endonuclease subunit S [Phocaeicola plebeius]|uniref:restriction endonuclease subunit S n=1 Tax=Phocaeicola plebeius TaxID=310297 RepID=UPI0029432A35|nr:restriction endonuclease subunit S [Phocaeicola plebeius]
MEEWKEYKASEFCESVTDGTHDSPRPKDEGFYLITSKHLKDSYIDFSSAKLISKEDYQKVIQRSKVEQYDILFSMIGTIGNTFRVTSPKIEFAVKNMGIFKFGGNNLNSKWFYYWLKSTKAKEYINTRVSGSTQGYLTLNSLREFPVLCPNYKTQETIVSILSSLDDKIELNRRINENLEQQAQALFKSWFVDFEPFKNGKFVDSELGMIPEGWKVCELGNLCDSISITHPCKKGELIFLNTGDIENGFVLTNKYMNIKDMPGQAKKSIKENDILYSEIRPINRHYAFVNFPAHEYIVSTKLMVIRAINEKLSIRLYQYLTSDDIINELQHEAESRSGTFPQIRFENIKKLKILIGPNNIENQYTEFIGNIYKMIFQYRKEIIKLEHLRDTLLPKLMSGELKINDFNN